MRVSIVVSVAALALAPVVAAGQGGAPATKAPVKSVSGLKKDVLYQLDDAEEKLVALANAIPPAKFGWRPAPGVRSVSEVLVHVAMENIEIPPMAAAPASVTKVAADAEKKTTEKAAVIDLLVRSFAYARQSISVAADAQMETPASYFGTAMTRRGVFIALATHGHEHLGQLIAYGRMNGIAPPWSQ